jgi:quercetin dioxygenase-like cupin family protein
MNAQCAPRFGSVATVGGKPIEARPEAVIYIPANVVHSGKAGADRDVVFFTVKDAAHSLHGFRAAG